jgi:serine/threonine protein kinase
MLLEVTVTTKASQGKHPNIVAFLGAVLKFPSMNEQQQDWAMGLVFELCDPYDCYHLLHTHKIKLTVEQKLRLVRESAAGLAHLHSLNIIHRDFGSRNLLIKDGHIKITDFGLARKMQDGNSFYQPSSVCGTLPWMSPEQVQFFPLCLNKITQPNTQAPTRFLNPTRRAHKLFERCIATTFKFKNAQPPCVLERLAR